MLYNETVKRSDRESGYVYLYSQLQPRYFEGSMKTGIFRQNDGVKITQHYLTPEEMKFNRIAAKDGALYRLVRESAGCFYVDRVQGGTFISHYDYDLDLADKYDRITDGRFLGFQIHESGCTRRLDWQRIQKQLAATGLSWNHENILYAVTRVSHDKNFPHFSSGFPEEYAALTPPETLSDYVNDLRGLWRVRQEQFHGRILNCDHIPSLCPLEQEFGVRVSFSEAGAQNGRTRHQIAMRRGVSRAAKKQWGVYLEPWGQSPCTSYLFKRDGENEWYIDGKNFLYHATDGNGGSSMSMARRMMYYALFGGADYFAEEWGQANTFYEWETFELSPYGRIKRDFLENARRFGQIVPYVPITVVIPHEYVLYPRSGRIPYPNDMIPEKHLDVPQKIHAFLDDGRRIGSEDHVFECGGLYSLFDLIYDDTYENPADKYELILDFSGRLHGEKIADGNDRAAADAAVGSLLRTLPFELDDGGRLDCQVFSSGGQSYLALYNHKGVSKSGERGEFRLEEADAPYTLRLKDGQIPAAVIPSDGFCETAEGAIHGVLKGGDMAVFRF